MKCRQQRHFLIMTNYTSEKIRIVSVLAILLVVFLHAYNLMVTGSDEILFEKTPLWFLQDMVSFGLTRVAVPLFFLVSGFLFFKGASGTVGEYRQKITKRFHSLFIPFVFWSAFGILFYLTLQSIPQLVPFFSKGLIRDYSFADLLTTLFVTPIPYQFWFIRDLMIMIWRSGTGSCFYRY
jgi:surface polysaccharide O-acyltransferase-like enzyme